MTTREGGQDAQNQLQPTPRRLAVLIGLGVLAALWALFQWGELLIARQGGESFCSINATFDCVGVWDSAFASFVHRATGLPVAAWGLVWGVVALALPLWALLQRALGRSPGAAWLGTVWTAAGGVGAIVVMAAAAIAGGHLCLTCLGTYVIVLAYAAVALSQLRLGTIATGRGGIVAALTVLVPVYLVLLVPGLRTPHARERASLASAPQVATATPAAEQSALARFLSQLSPPARQMVSDSIAALNRSPDVPMHAPRALLGSPNAPVRITDFTDILCSHCAALHETLAELRRVVPPEQLAIESRQFPLDGGCNRYLQSPPAHPVRCLAAKAQICLEANPNAFTFSAALFAKQEQLTEAMVYDIAAPYMQRKALEACVNSSDIERKLQDDLDWAMAFNIDGTPLVLVNGREGTPFGPFLYALALTGGSLNDPALASLPPPRTGPTMH